MKKKNTNERIQIENRKKKITSRLMGLVFRVNFFSNAVQSGPDESKWQGVLCMSRTLPPSAGVNKAESACRIVWLLGRTEKDCGKGTDWLVCVTKPGRFWFAILRKAAFIMFVIVRFVMGKLYLSKILSNVFYNL